MTRTPDETELSRVKPAPADLGPLFNLLAAEATGEVSTGEAFAHLGSYDGPRATPPTAPRVREPAPSVRNAASEAAADSLSPEVLEKENRRVYVWFQAQAVPRTRHECAAALYVGSDGIANLGSACGRVNQLVAHGWLVEDGKSGKRSTLRVMTAEERRAFLRRAA